MAPLIPFRTAGMVCAGPRWMASSCNLASTKRTYMPGRVRLQWAFYADFIERLDDEFASFVEVLIPLVSLTSTLVPLMA